MPQTAGPGTITSPNRDTRTLSHRGTEVGSENLTLKTNQVNNDSPIIEWNVPKKYKQMVYAAGKHMTKAVFRSREEISGTTGDDTVVSLSADISPIAGETEIADQPFPVCVAYNVTTGTEYSITNVDYAANEVTLGTDPASGDTVALWPAFNDGSIHYIAYDQFGNVTGPLDEWGVPVHVFNDFNQENNKTAIHLVGAGKFREAETLAMWMNAPHQVVWEDADYPRGQYASHLEQRVDVEV